MTLVTSTLLGNLDIPHEQGISFGNLNYLTDGSIPMPTTDFYDGSPPSAIECGLREEVGKFIIPSNNPSAAILPTFLMAVAAPSTSMTYLGRAAWIYGALAARGVHHLRSNLPLQTMNNKKAYVLTADYSVKTCKLRLFTTHVVTTHRPPSYTETYTVSCGDWSLVKDAEKFRDGISALRNAREWARDQRESLILISKGMIMRSFVTIP